MSLLVKEKKTEIYMMYLLPILFFAYLVVQVIIPSGEQDLEDQRLKIIEVDSQLHEYELKLKTIKDGYEILNILKAQNNKKSRQIEEITKDNAIVDEKISAELSKMKYTNLSWSAYLSSITEKATSQNVKLETFTNKIGSDLKPNIFQKILDADINATGSYVDVMKFLDFLETDDSITEITKLDMKLDKNATKTGSSKNVSVQTHINLWGTK